MPRGVKWDYSLYIESHSVGNSQCWTQYVGRQKSGVFWIGSYSWEGGGSWSCETPGDFIEEIAGFDQYYVDQFFRYFLTNSKYSDVVSMMKWRRKDIRIIKGGQAPN